MPRLEDDAEDEAATLRVEDDAEDEAAMLRLEDDAVDEAAMLRLEDDVEDGAAIPTAIVGDAAVSMSATFFGNLADRISLFLLMSRTSACAAAHIRHADACGVRIP
jgi:hypothetical protein